jgi:predicted double-glycine peptidase
MISIGTSHGDSPRVPLWNDVHKTQDTLIQRVHNAFSCCKALINLPAGRQTFDFDCGPKALQLVLAYYGLDIREDKLIKELETDHEGTSVENIITYASKHDFNVFAECGVSIETIKNIIREGTPVITLIQAWSDKGMTLFDWEKDYEDGHYVVVIGYHDDIIIFQDPSSFKRTWMTEREFLARWHDRCPRTQKKYDRFALALFGKPAENLAFAHLD